jgi:hypothetical protein
LAFAGKITLRAEVLFCRFKPGGDLKNKGDIKDLKGLNTQI